VGVSEELIPMSKLVYLFSTSSHADAISINSLDIQLLQPKIDFSKYDHLIITSKQVSNALHKYDDKSYRDLKALCISEQSALAFEEIGGKILELGSGYGDSLVKTIKRYPKETRWLYLRAKVIASDFTQVCSWDGYSIDEMIVYESKCSQDILETKIDDNAILIFTSPSSVVCFLKRNKISSNSHVIVIGTSTAKALPKGVAYTISKKRTIQSCMDLSGEL
jgi:uroporphyrinogen-III synthase